MMPAEPDPLSVLRRLWSGDDPEKPHGSGRFEVGYKAALRDVADDLSLPLFKGSNPAPDIRPKNGAIDATIAHERTNAVGFGNMAGRALKYGELLLEILPRRRRSELHSSSVNISKQIHSMRSNLRGWMQDLSLTIEDRVGRELGDQLEPSLERVVYLRRARGHKENTLRSFRSQIRRVAVYVAETREEAENADGSFATALTALMTKHRVDASALANAVGVQDACDPTTDTIFGWASGDSVPGVASLQFIGRMEEFFNLRRGQLAMLVADSGINLSPGAIPAGIFKFGRRRYSQHLPEDFDQRPAREQAMILEWVRDNILEAASKPTPKQRFLLKLPANGGKSIGSVDAPAALVAEVRELVKYKTDTLSPALMAREGTWSRETARMLVGAIATFFGALKLEGATEGAMTLALLASVNALDWFLGWRLRERGYHTGSEIRIVEVARNLVRPSGWLAQQEWLAQRLEPIPGIIDASMIDAMRQDWAKACETTTIFCRKRRKELVKTSAIGRDESAGILCVLDAERPLDEYAKILTEIDKRRPDPTINPISAAIAARAWLIIRVGLETGLRSRNLRELWIKAKGASRTPLAVLRRIRRGEVFWNPDANKGAGGWNIVIPRQAFKNGESSFWAKHDYENSLADIGALYQRLDEYLRIHRPILLAGRASDCLFITSPERNSGPEIESEVFYIIWRRIIERYGIYNPGTGRGALPGLRPHGPHAGIRDVLATHVLKITGSIEDAAAAIQDVPASVASYYARWIPRDRISRIKPLIVSALD